MTAIADAGGSQLMIALDIGEAAGERLSAALTAAPIASVVLRPAADRAPSARDVAAIVEQGQKAGAAMLIAGDTELARAVRADGVHLPINEKAVASLEEARAWLGGRSIVGGDAGRSRDDAMSLGEAGADYVAFGIPDFVKAREEAVERRLELVAWWSEIFEVPVVAMDVADASSAGALAAAGADFVCVTLPRGSSVPDVVALVAGCHRALLDNKPADPR